MNYRNASGRDAQGRYPYRQPAQTREAIRDRLLYEAGQRALTQHRTNLAHTVFAAQGTRVASMVYSPRTQRILSDHRRGPVSPLGGRAW